KGLMASARHGFRIIPASPGISRIVKAKKPCFIALIAWFLCVENKRRAAWLHAPFYCRLLP
ncbi:hypothetical protein, partial [Methylomonas koyamae]|uniref:hypothetical protein n=1 Tax=Methylomonas koyamae TaxID=702114 RepID=UPI001E302709